MSVFLLMIDMFVTVYDSAISFWCILIALLLYSPPQLPYRRSTMSLNHCAPFAKMAGISRNCSVPCWPFSSGDRFGPLAVWVLEYPAIVCKPNKATSERKQLRKGHSGLTPVHLGDTCLQSGRGNDTPLCPAGHQKFSERSFPFQHAPFVIAINL